MDTSRSASEISEALSRPFRPDEIKTRQGGGNRTLRYITARSAMSRLDEVVGPANWRNTFRRESFAEGLESVICRIEIRFDGEWVGKEDAGGFKVMTERVRGEEVEDDENTVKTGYSDAFKRSAVMWGIARYLYSDSPGERGASAPCPPRTSRSAPDSGRDHGPSRAGREFHGRASGHATEPSANVVPAPTAAASGKGLLNWIREQDPDRDGLADRLTKAVAKWGIEKGYGGVIRDWSRDQAIAAYRWLHAEMTREVEHA